MGGIRRWLGRRRRKPVVALGDEEGRVEVVAEEDEERGHATHAVEISRRAQRSRAAAITITTATIGIMAFPRQRKESVVRETRQENDGEPSEDEAQVRPHRRSPRDLAKPGFDDDDVVSSYAAASLAPRVWFHQGRQVCVQEECSAALLVFYRRVHPKTVGIELLRDRSARLLNPFQGGETPFFFFFRGAERIAVFFFFLRRLWLPDWMRPSLSFLVFGFGA